jgi:regulator of RNase E activity RraA
MVDPQSIEPLSGVSTPSVINGLKRLGVPPTQLQIMDRSLIQCMAPGLGVRVGFAATRKVATRRSGKAPEPPPNRRPDGGLLDVPAPRILVVENVGDWRGPVCIWGDLTANINVALDCRAGITNGPVRDLPEMEAVGFQTFAGGAAAGGGYVDILEQGGPVTVGGVTVHPGDVIHADQHGVLKVPAELLADLPQAIAETEASERRVIAACQAKPFSLEALAEAMYGQR